MAPVAGIAATAFLIFALLGCGGGDDNSEPSLTKAAFVKQGNALCKKERKERDKVAEAAVEKYLAEETPEAKKEAVIAVVRHYEQTTAHLAELGAPEGEEKEVAQMIEAMEEGASRAKADPERAYEEFYPFKDANKAVEEYGLTECTA